MEGTFHRFIDLPYDIRHSIYTLATPPRVVEVEEGPLDRTKWNRSSGSRHFPVAYQKHFEEFKLLGPPNIDHKLHPDLAHFAHNWRPRLAGWPPAQQTLDSYGFTSSRPAYEPWKPSKETPRIPNELINGSRELAFMLTRKFSLYSNSEIPVFLHVCAESRQALMEWGYRLFFSTRTCEPRTWFNPDRDRLYMASDAYRDIPNLNPLDPTPDEIPPIPYPDDEDPRELLSGSGWDIGLYSVQDLKAIKKVILGVENKLSPDDVFVHQLKNILPLLSNLDELFLENMRTMEFESLYHLEWKYTTLASSTHCILVEDIDAIGWTDGTGAPMLDTRHTGYLDEDLRPFMATSSESWHLAKAKEFEAQLLEWKSRSAIAQKVDVRIPTFRFVNLVPDECAELYLNTRHGLWKAITSLTDEEIRQPDFGERFKEMNVFPQPFNVKWKCFGTWLECLDYMQRSSEELTDPVNNVYLLQVWYILNRLKFTEPQCRSL